MALMWIDGFDAYPSADLTSKYNLRGTAFTVVPSVGRFSSGALSGGNTGGGEVVAKFFQSRKTWILGAAFKYTYSTSGSFPTKVFSFQDVGGYQVELWLNGSQILELKKNNGATLLATGTHTLFQDTYYYLEFKATIGSSGYVEVRIGGVTECSFTGNTDPQATGVAAGFYLHYDHFRVFVKFDDLYVLDDTGIRNNNFLGDMRVETRLATGQGTASDFSLTGAATHYGAVNEAGDDGDTSYLSSSNVGAKEAFTLPALTSTPLVIAGVQQTTVARKDDAGIRKLAAYLRIDGADYFGDDIPLTDNYTYDSTILENNPATTAAWTRDELEAAQIGFKLTG